MGERDAVISTALNTLEVAVAELCALKVQFLTTLENEITCGGEEMGMFQALCTLEALIGMTWPTFTFFVWIIFKYGFACFTNKYCPHKRVQRVPVLANNLTISASTLFGDLYHALDKQYFWISKRHIFITTNDDTTIQDPDINRTVASFGNIKSVWFHPFLTLKVKTQSGNISLQINGNASFNEIAHTLYTSPFAFLEYLQYPDDIAVWHEKECICIAFQLFNIQKSAYIAFNLYENMLDQPIFLNQGLCKYLNENDAFQYSTDEEHMEIVIEQKAYLSYGSPNHTQDIQITNTKFKEINDAVKNMLTVNSYNGGCLQSDDHKTIYVNLLCHQTIFVVFDVPVLVFNLSNVLIWKTFTQTD